MNMQNLKIASLLEGQGVLEKGLAKKGEKHGGPEQGFLRYLDKALGRGKTDALPWTEDITKGAISKQGWFALFKQGLFSSGVALKDMSLSNKALDGLKELLLADGFSEEDVKGLLDGLLQNSANKKINLQHLLHEIGALQEKTKERSPDLVLEASELPYLDTLLRSFGLSAQQAEGIISQSRVDSGQLSLKALARNLKPIGSEIQADLRSKMGELSGEAAKTVLTRMGLSDEAGKLNGPVSLEQFVQLVEEKVASLVSYRFSDGQRKQRVVHILENVSVNGEEKTVTPKQQSKALETFPFQSVEANDGGQPWKKKITNQWRQVDSQGNRVAEDNYAAPKTNSHFHMDGLDISNKGQHGSNVTTAKMEALIEAATERPSQKTADSNKLAVSLEAHENGLQRLTRGETAVKPDVRTIPQYVVHQVGRRLGMALKRGENHVRLQLKPPHLGSIQLDLAMKGNEVRIAMVAENQYVKDLMISHVNELKDALGGQGVELQKIDVEINQGFQHSMANAEKQFCSPRMWAARNSVPVQEEPEEDMIAPHTMAGHISHDGRVDMFA